MNALEAIEFAIQNEKAAMEQYRRLADESFDPDTRLMFTQISQDEGRHLRLLEDRLKALKVLKIAGEV